MAVPPGVIGDGMMRVVVLTSFNGTLTASAANAGTDITCYFTSDGFNRALNEATVNDDRLCSTQSGEEPGRYNETLDVQYIWDQQNGTPTDNVAYNTLVPGAKKFFAVRYAKLYTAPFEPGDIVDVLANTPGQRGRNAPAANEKLKIGQKLFIPADGVTYDLELT